MRGSFAIRLPLVLALWLGTGACSSLGYYAHVTWGGARLAVGGETVEKLLGDSETSPQLREHLELARDILTFAGGELSLPVDGKYRKYVALDRPYVVWTVVAAPELSLDPRLWCFPIAGCVSYRGFFDEERARRFAARLEARGFDVSVDGVRAYSTLGWLRDPLLSTFLALGEVELAGLLVHELAHGVAYVRDDSSFNESLATFVEREGVRRWLEVRGSVSEQRRLEAAWSSDRAALAAIATTRAALTEVYGSADSDQIKLAQKAELFEALRDELADLGRQTASPLALAWSGRTLNNADLVALGTYEDRVEDFASVYRSMGGELDGFYAAVRCLAALDANRRGRLFADRDWSECVE